MDRAQEVEFYNPSLLYQARDVVFWNVLNGFQLFRRDSRTCVGC